MSLSETLYPLLSIVSNQDMTDKNDLDVTNQNKQAKDNV